MATNLPPPSPLSYEGQVVTPYIRRPFGPSSTFNKFPVSTIWIDTASEAAFILVSVKLGFAHWIPIGGAPGTLDTLTTEDHVVVTPTLGTINVVGDGTFLTTTGNIATSTVKVNLVKDVTLTYVENVGTASSSSGLLNVLGSQGVTTTGVSNTVTVVGSPTKAVASSSLANLGTASFDSAHFTADANGWVQRKGTVLSQVKLVTFTANGTYTPTAGMQYCTVEVCGGGGGGGGTGATDATSCFGGAGGGSGGYARSVLTAAAVGGSQTVTVGAGGAGGVAGVQGTNGGTTSFGALVVATGGTASTDAPSPGADTNNPGLGGVGTAGQLLVNGNSGHCGYGLYVLGADKAYFSSFGGAGGSSYFGGGSAGVYYGPSNGVNGTNYGAGGGGGCAPVTSAATTGGNGSAGVVVITEYI